MPTLDILYPTFRVDSALFHITTLDVADITSSSATQIVMVQSNETFTLTGMGFPPQ